MQKPFPLRLSLFLAGAFALSGCGGGSNSGPSVPGEFRSPQTRTLVSFRDPWTASQPRFMDIDDRPLPQLRNSFSYANAQVALTYDAAPATPYFKGRLRARGLKPNFAYQLKLAGKPVSGARGWKQFGDDASNERVGRIGRWWHDESQRNEVDSTFDSDYKNAAPDTRRTIYGYQLMALAVTDSKGEVDVAFDGSGSFHVTWQDKQTFGHDFDAGTFSIGTQPPYYGYGQAVETRNIKLWLEREVGRPTSVRLPAGQYNVRFVLTEESFHNYFGGTNSSDGGMWQTVLANEDFRAGQPDTSPANDITFSIS
ncbi:MAG TPA: hypothetical protein VF681_07070 [Abditibacteriaceae bacterium]|jgi:hypothetical protein